jgi:hypothetical protein
MTKTSIFSTPRNPFLMSTAKDDTPGAKYYFKAKYGAEPSRLPVSEPSHEEIDAFVKGVLGLTKDKEK